MRHEQSKATVVPDIPVFSLERDFPTSTVKKKCQVQPADMENLVFKRNQKFLPCLQYYGKILNF